MTPDRFIAKPHLANLKDFQRSTVDYVFDRLYDENSSGRFLVADEVGLGKTLVAKGVIAQALEHLQDVEERIDVIYVCSNAAIAEQNVNRLNVSGDKRFAIASRLTFLPLQVQNLKKNKINFISFTPGTTFDLKSRGGRVEERVVLFRMLKNADWNVGKGLFNMLRANVERKNWKWWAEKWEAEIDSELETDFRAALAKEEELSQKLHKCCEIFASYKWNSKIPKHVSNQRYELIGKLRLLLARTCINALEPDLVILDEFQRFKNLMDGDDDAAFLANELFGYPNVRTLLLSATPYRMLAMDHEQEDDHYPDFIRTLSFLFDDPEQTKEIVQIKQDIQNYRQALYSLDNGDSTHIEEAKKSLQTQLLKVMCRTERVGITRRLDAMLIEPNKKALLQSSDLHQAAIADQAARAVGAREPIEYWKSSPYLLNFLKHYDLRRKIDAVIEAPPDDLLAALHHGKSQLLREDQFESYQEVAAANARMRQLFQDTLDRGLWRLLWLPPSMPYTTPEGAYEGIDSVTKALVFSAWNVVPDAIAALCSYEAERRMLEGLDRTIKHSELYDRLKPLLRFAKGKEDRLTGMPVLAWMAPSPTLAKTINPLELSLQLGQGEPVSLSAVLEVAKAECEKLLEKLPKGSPGNRADERWYWAAPALLERKNSFGEWCQTEWTNIDEGKEPGSRFVDHINHYIEVINREIELGPRPDDLAQTLAELAVGGPGNCALRALQRIAPKEKFDSPLMLTAAARISEGFRTLFNLPETIGLLRGSGEDHYWQLALRYGMQGNLQAVLDEQVHTLVESLGLTGHPSAEKVDGISRNLANALSLRIARIKVDELKPNGDSIEHKDFNTRCRFALRFGDIRDDKDSTLARADVVREAFNSPFRPFVLASTSIGQEGLDFHTWCHAVVHWNLPSNPVDLEQREGRVHRYKGHAVRKNIAESLGLKTLLNWNGQGDPWDFLFKQAAASRGENTTELVPYWIYEEGSARIERRIPLIPFSREVQHLAHLKKSLALYRLVFGQPRQEDLLSHLAKGMADNPETDMLSWGISLTPPKP